MGTKIGILIIFILLQCSIALAIKPLRGNITTEEEETPPKEIQEAIEKEKEMKEEVIQRRKEKEAEEKSKEIVTKKPIPAKKTISKTPSITAIITALIILLIAFYIYRRK